MKQITRTPDLDARLRASFGPDAQISSLVVFEAIAANTMKLRKTGGIYQGARMSESLLAEMAASVKQESVPFHMMHNTSTEPVGRVFDGRVVGEELYVQFAINRETQAKLVSDINAGVVDQVSVGILSQKLLCSECGWDYLGADANYENFWDLTCANGHTIGKDGVHVRLVGLSAWLETSGVGKGAVQGARIIGDHHSVFEQRRLAANIGVSPLKLACIASPETITPEPTNIMELHQLIADLTTAKAEGITLTAQLAAATAQVAELTAQLATERAANKVDPTQLEAATKMLTDICRRSMIATGDQSPTVPSDIAGLVATITDRQAKLSAMIPVGGRSLPADQDTQKPVPANLTAYTLRS